MPKIQLNQNLIYGSEALRLFQFAKQNQFAIPAVNTTSSSNINASLETAAKLNSPIIVQFSHSGAAFLAGKSIDNSTQKASVAGAIAGAKHIHQLAKEYGVKVMIHTDHCAKKLLPWVDGLLEVGEEFYKKTGSPLFGSHMLDLSQEPLTENIEICKRYLEKMSKLEMILEIELGVTGGEEDGVDNSGVDDAKLYTQPADVALAYKELSQISPNFTIAASFGNVHGVYKPGNVKLHPIILKNSQDFVQKQFQTVDKPLNLVFHGGSGSTEFEIKEAVSYGVIKMNIDTDLQWAYWAGIKDYYTKNHDYLQSQLGNPQGADMPNKKIYDPRVWLRSAEESYIQKLESYFRQLNSVDILA
jgi:fructose-bisphosphate aldolase, class II